ncbi:MAG: hypothetical protein ACU0B1_03190 [Thermohalobaculum sp.]
MNNQVEIDKEFEQLAKLLDSIEPPLGCLRCGHKPLQLLDDPANGLRSVVPMRSERSISGGLTKGVNVLTVICPNCGHVEQFAEEMLRRNAAGNAE